jgi:hypothetical protein
MFNVGLLCSFISPQVHVGQNIKFCLRNVELLRNVQFVYQKVQGPHYFYSVLLDLQEFIIQVLVHLDILVEPKRYSQEQQSVVQSYLVPCIVKRKLPVTDADYKSKEDKMICLSYKLLKSSIPAALSFKLMFYKNV